MVLNNEATLQGATAAAALSLSPNTFTPSPPHPPPPQYFHIAVDTVFKCLWKSFNCHGWRRHKITISVTNELVRERRQLDLCQRS